MTEPFQVSGRVNGDDPECTDLEMRSATEKFTIGTVGDEYAAFVINAINCHNDMLAALKIVAAGIWHDKARNACGLSGAALAVHAVEAAIAKAEDAVEAYSNSKEGS